MAATRKNRLAAAAALALTLTLAFSGCSDTREAKTSKPAETTPTTQTTTPAKSFQERLKDAYKVTDLHDACDPPEEYWPCGYKTITQENDHEITIDLDGAKVRASFTGYPRAVASNFLDFTGDILPELTKVNITVDGKSFLTQER